MTREEIIKKIQEEFKQFLKLDLTILYSNGSSAQDFPNHSLSDVKLLVECSQRLIKQLLEKWSLMDSTTFNLVNGINSSLDAFLKQFAAVSKLKPEQLTNQHHNPLKQLVAINMYLRQSGLYSILSPSIDIPKLEGNLNDLYVKASEIVDEAKEKAAIIRDLIPEATATSLSVSLDDRAKAIQRRVNFWLGTVIIVLIGSFYLSYSFLLNSEKKEQSSDKKLVSTITSKIDQTKKVVIDTTSIFEASIKKPSIDSKDIKTDSKLSKSLDRNSFTYWIKRAIIFLPLFYLIVFCIKQYNRERKLLEIYIHKKSIGQTLPAYIEQALSDETKDEILLRGATMIFTLPENPDTPVQGSEGIATSELKNILDIKKNLTS